jgi:hypothetical protein
MWRVYSNPDPHRYNHYGKKGAFTTDLPLIPFYSMQGVLKPMSLNPAVLTVFLDSILPRFIMVW